MRRSPAPPATEPYSGSRTDAPQPRDQAAAPPVGGEGPYPSPLLPFSAPGCLPLPSASTIVPRHGAFASVAGARRASRSRPDRGPGASREPRLLARCPPGPGTGFPRPRRDCRRGRGRRRERSRVGAGGRGRVEAARGAGQAPGDDRGIAPAAAGAAGPAGRRLRVRPLERRLLHDRRGRLLRSREPDQDPSRRRPADGRGPRRDPARRNARDARRGDRDRFGADPVSSARDQFLGRAARRADDPQERQHGDEHADRAHRRDRGGQLHLRRLAPRPHSNRIAPSPTSRARTGLHPRTWSPSCTGPSTRGCWVPRRASCCCPG